jgi:hypothetical protein
VVATDFNTFQQSPTDSFIQSTHKHSRGEVVATCTITQRFLYKSIQDDYLVCRTWNGTTEGDEDVKIARPWLLRRSPRDSTFVAHDLTAGSPFPYIRKAIKGFAVESQRLVPGYVVNDEIYATKHIDAPVLIQDSAGDPAVIYPQAEVWIDDNRDGRCWAKVQA